MLVLALTVKDRHHLVGGSQEGRPGQEGQQAFLLQGLPQNRPKTGQALPSPAALRGSDLLKAQGFRSVRLGRVKGNPESEAFWVKNQFTPTGIETDGGGYTIVVMQREL